MVNAFFLGFYQLARFLANNKLGWFKTISRSLECLLVLLFLEYISLYAYMIFQLHLYISVKIIVDVLILPIQISLVMFESNIIQFGVDQLQDTPADHQSLFIYWYVWIYY